MDIGPKQTQVRGSEFSFCCYNDTKTQGLRKQEFLKINTMKTKDKYYNLYPYFYAC